MTTLRVPRPIALDASTHEFIATFMSHVATIAGYGRDRTATIAQVKALLLAAIEYGNADAEPAWSVLHQMVSEIVETAHDAPDTRSSHAYLRSFVQENVDLVARAGTPATR